MPRVPAAPPRASVTVAGDGMSASVVVAAGQHVDPAELAALLQSARVVAGVDAAACTLVHAGKARPGANVVARGVPAVDGADGAFVATFEAGLLPGKMREDGSIDFHERDLVKSVAVGEVLGELRPPCRGTDGVRVDGRPPPARVGRPATMRFGAGVALGEDRTARATRAGVIVHRAGVSLDVTDGHVHAADVDLHSGDLKVKGSLSVRGNVARSFGVSATGDVDVRDAVDGGSVRAGGSAKVGGTARGGGDAIVWADGDVSLRTAESALVHAGGTLRVVEALNSQLHGKRVEVTRRVRGGATFAEESLVVQEAGAPDGTDTQLTAGEPLDRSAAEAVAAVQAAKRAREAKRPAAERGAKAGRMQAAASADQTRERIAAAERREALLEGARVRVTGTVHPGVVIHIGAARYAVDTEVRGVVFALDRETRTIAMERTRA